ncbi:MULTISPECIES: hypothetical protein [Sorangium]
MSSGTLSGASFSGFRLSGVVVRACEAWCQGAAFSIGREENAVGAL